MNTGKSTLAKKKAGTIQISVVTPAFNESKNLTVLYARLKRSLAPLRLSWEWIVIDDHSADSTYAVMEKVAGQDKHVRVLRFAKNSGSHLALACGLREAKGKCAVGMAADLQDPPETIAELLEKWKKGAQVVWAVREKREGESFGTVFFARLYYFIVRYGVGMRQVPPSGADYFLLDRQVLEALAQARLKNASLLLLISSLPFRQDFITYTKKERLHGKSGWNLRKKFKLFFDSVTMFSKAPVYWVLGAGLVLGAGGAWMALEPERGGFVPVLGSFLALSGLACLGLSAFLFLRLLDSSERPLFSIEKKSGRKNH